jgi:thioredoxin 1
MSIRKLLLCVTFLVASAAAFAADRLVYAAKPFQDAVAAGKPILVHVTAPWCGECKAQKPVVAALVATPAYAELTIFDVDYDTQKDALRELKVQKQSTLVVYKGATEVARAVGITRRDEIEALMKKAL